MEPPTKKRKKNEENVLEIVQKLQSKVLELEKKLEQLKRTKDYSSSYIS